MNYNQLKVFTTVVECHGISAAAVKLNVSPTAVSKQIKNLENILCVQLIQRTTTHFKVTEVGMALYKRCQQIHQQVNSLKDMVQSYRNEPCGELKLFSSIAFGDSFVLPHIKAFTEAYPKILLELEINDRIPDVQNESIDICLGLAGHWDQNLIQKKLFTTQSRLWAAPSYLKAYGQPVKSEELINHHFICHSNRPTPYTLSFQDGSTITLQPRILVNNCQALFATAVAGMGIVQLYDFMIKGRVYEEQLEMIDVQKTFPETSYYGFYPPSSFLKPAVRAILNFFQEIFKHNDNDQ